MGILKSGKAYLLLFLTFFLWGSIYVAGKLVSDIPASLVAAMRCLIACFPLLVMARRHFSIKIDKEDIKYFVAVGALGYFLTVYMVQLGISYTGASMAALINATTPIGITVLAVFILNEKITPIKVLCLVLAIAGTAVITFGTDTHGELLGIAAVLVAVLSFSVASCFMRKLTAKYPSILVTAYGMVISLVFYIPLSIVTLARTEGIHVSGYDILVLLYLGFAGSGLAQYTWTTVLGLLPASTCSLFYPLQPLFAALLGALILHESFKPTFFIGLVLISSDIVLSAIEARSAPKS
jgi:drug/metabolite transporter (DMT)-like permease